MILKIKTSFYSENKVLMSQKQNVSWYKSDDLTIKTFYIKKSQYEEKIKMLREKSRNV